MVKITGPRVPGPPPAPRGKPGAPAAPDPSQAVEPLESRMEVLSVVEGQIENIHHELDLQMKRIAQLQGEVDEVRKAIKQLAGKSS